MVQSEHAVVRSQQRGVPQLIVDLLLRFGEREPSSGGTEIVYFSRSSRKRVQNYVGGMLGKMNEHLDAYAVICNGSVVTVGPRFKRIRHM
jgi:hypothetical protein